MSVYRGPAVIYEGQGLPPSRAHEGMRWVLVLNRYERDNLLWLLNLLGYGKAGVEPFTIANTGDWVGEIAMMLADPDDYSLDAEESGKPNLRTERVVNLLDSWVARKVREKFSEIDRSYHDREEVQQPDRQESSKGDSRAT
jgi:hypothetical protein